MSLFYEGRIHCFSPYTFLSKKKIASIRPLIYVPEKDVVGFARKQGLPIVKNKCKADGNTKREEIKIQVYTSRWKEFDPCSFLQGDILVVHLVHERTQR